MGPHDELIDEARAATAANVTLRQSHAGSSRTSATPASAIRSLVRAARSRRTGLS